MDRRVSQSRDKDSSRVTRFIAVCIACRSVVQRVRPLRISHPSKTARRAHISRNQFVTRSANDKNQLIYVQKLFRITAYNSRNVCYTVIFRFAYRIGRDYSRQFAQYLMSSELVPGYWLK